MSRVVLGRVSEVTAAYTRVEIPGTTHCLINRARGAVPSEVRSVGQKVVMTYRTSRSSGLWYAEPFFNDSAEGARAALKYLADEETNRAFADAIFFPDPAVAGVWGADAKGSKGRAIIYLAGYKNPFGDLRDTNDFEIGERP